MSAGRYEPTFRTNPTNQNDQRQSFNNNSSVASSELNAYLHDFYIQSSYKAKPPPPLATAAQISQFIPAGILPIDLASPHLRPSTTVLEPSNIRSQHNTQTVESHAPVAAMDKHLAAANIASNKHMLKEDLLQLMQQINSAVKANNFSPSLSNQIFTLCNELKGGQGAVMEQLHKDELNRVFVSLRQACCRDAGQLGTPCRLKIMELVELKSEPSTMLQAMGWRTNLAHSQYYLTRNGTLSTGNSGPTVTSIASPVNEDISSPAPISAPPFGTVPVNPFAFNMAAAAAAGIPTSINPGVVPHPHTVLPPPNMSSMPGLHHGSMGSSNPLSDIGSSRHMRGYEPPPELAMQLQRHRTFVCPDSGRSNLIAHLATQQQNDYFKAHHASELSLNSHFSPADRFVAQGGGPTPQYYLIPATSSVAHSPHSGITFLPGAPPGMVSPMVTGGAHHPALLQSQLQSQHSAYAADVQEKYESNKELIYATTDSTNHLIFPDSVARTSSHMSLALSLTNESSSAALSAQTAALSSMSVPHLPLAQSPGAMSTGSGSGSISGLSGCAFPRGAAIKTSGQRPQKVPGKNQFRDEVVIRNADSGKVMGIKGRRIAVIEELSKTVVSFQKVAPNAKERVLTITGPEELNIEHAKSLVQQTIQRNASPNREDGVQAEPLTNGSSLSAPDPTADAADLLAGLTANDPKLLEVAKEALREYFQRHADLRRSFTDLPSANDADERKERRKSMPPIAGNVVVPGLPLPSNGQSMADADPNWRNAGEGNENCSSDEATASLKSPSSNSSTARSRYQSTPNLNRVPEAVEEHDKSNPDDGSGDGGAAAGGDTVLVDKTGGVSVLTAPGSPGGLTQMRVVYTREYLLQCALSPMAAIPPPGMAAITLENEQVMRSLPGRFEPVEYKNVCEQLKNLQLQLYAARQANPATTPPTGGFSSGAEEAFPFPVVPTSAALVFQPMVQ